MDLPASYSPLSLRAQREEFLNVCTHGLGAVASAVGGAVLITLAALYGDVWRIVGVSVFVASLVLLYTASTLYHASRQETTRARLRVLDHSAIYVLIAGTYTPFTLVGLRGGWGWSIFGVVWGLALAGILFKRTCTGRFERLSTLLYIAMGWLIVVAIGPLIQALSITTLLWILAGGLCYTLGTVFFASRRIPFAHAIWHLFVLGGSACHFVAVVTHVV